MKEPQPCGTRAAYVRHIRKAETPCAACRKANSASARRAGFARAYMSAQRILARRHRAEFLELYEREKARLKNAGGDE